jgi:hypothetical protein
LRKVKIVKCSDQSYWYRNSIGKVYDARIGYPGTVLVRADDGYANYIFGSDFVFVDTEFVKIKECSNSGLWYSTEIGKTFPVVHQTEHAFWCGGVLGNQNAWVYKSDVEVTFGG